MLPAARSRRRIQRSVRDRDRPRGRTQADRPHHPLGRGVDLRECPVCAVCDPHVGRRRRDGVRALADRDRVRDHAGPWVHSGHAAAEPVGDPDGTASGGDRGRIDADPDPIEDATGAGIERHHLAPRRGDDPHTAEGERNPRGADHRREDTSHPSAAWIDLRHGPIHGIGNPDRPGAICDPRRPISDMDCLHPAVGRRIDAGDTSVEAVGYPYRAGAGGEGLRAAADVDRLHRARLGVDARYGLVGAVGNPDCSERGNDRTR